MRFRGTLIVVDELLRISFLSLGAFSFLTGLLDLLDGLAAETAVRNCFLLLAVAA
jgi:hypothetical protein